MNLKEIIDESDFNDQEERYFLTIDDKVQDVKSMLKDIKGDMKYLTRKPVKQDENIS